MTQDSALEHNYNREFLNKIAFGNANDAFILLESNENGLSEEDVIKKQKQFGLNVISNSKEKHPVIIFFMLFVNPLAILLLCLATVSIIMNDIRTAVILIFMVLLSVVLTFIQEYRSGKSADKLKAMIRIYSIVKRRKTNEDKYPEIQNVPIAELVPGDIVILSAGDLIPADLMILNSKDLFINQSTLTGESLPVEKTSDIQNTGTISPFDYENICFMGSTVVSGSAVGLVIVTGQKTFFGQIGEIIAKHQKITNFDEGIKKFTWLMIKFILVMVPLVFLINGFGKGDWIEAFLFAVAVGVGLTPEMLPAIVTINLSQGAITMSKEKVIVKRLNSIQNFGAIDVLCADKTGTITQDKIILEKHVDLFGNESQKVFSYAYLNSYYQTGLKNLLDREVLKHSETHYPSAIQNKFKKIDEIPFDFVRRRMSVILQSEDNKNILICKGAVKEIFDVCVKAETKTEKFNLDKNHLETLNKVVEELNSDGFRVIAVAYKEFTDSKNSYTKDDESDLTMLGYIAFLDPPKETAAKAMNDLSKLGIKVKILSGDNDTVTKKICREVNLQFDKVYTGADLENMTNDRFSASVEEGSVFAKLTPEQKAKIITALRQNGHVVGFLGDGINDSAALKASDVGISVDTAADIAKDTADIILLEKDLMVLSKGVMRGRQVFGNIIKYIKMGASSNFGNMLSIIGSSLFLPFLPMLPIQIIANNMLYDISQTTIPTDNVDEDYLKQPRKWDISNITKFMFFMGPVSSLFDYATFFSLLYFLNCFNNPALFQTGWFVESAVSQILIIHVIRTAKIPFIESRASTPLIISSVLIVLFAIWLPYSPFADSLGFVKIPVEYWTILSIILPCYIISTTAVKNLIGKKYNII